MNIQTFLRSAALAHSAGRLADSAGHCRRAGTVEPGTVAPYVNLALALATRGETDGELDWVERAAGLLSSGNPTVARNLGVVAHQRGNRHRSFRWLRRAIMSAPDDPKALIALAKQFSATDNDAALDVAWALRATAAAPDRQETWALLLERLVVRGLARQAEQVIGRIPWPVQDLGSELLRLMVHCLSRTLENERADECLAILIDRDPLDVELLASRTGQLNKLERFAEACACGRRAVIVDPGSFDTNAAYASAVARSGQHGDVSSGFNRALLIAPERRPDLLEQYGAGLIKVDYGPKAARVLQEALVWDPGNVSCYLNLSSNAFYTLDLPRARKYAERTCIMDPEFPEGLYNLGMIRRFDGRPDEAIDLLRRVTDMKPEPSFFFTRALVELSDGDVTDGLKSFESRWRVPKFAAYRDLHPEPTLPIPVWRGEPLEGRTLAVWGEQGVGDELWFSSYIGQVAGRARRLIIEVTPHLATLVQRTYPEAQVMRRGDPETENALRQADYQIPMGGLMSVEGARLLPVDTGYFVCDPERVADIRSRHASGDTPLIGISWRSRKQFHKRSFEAPLEDWVPVFALAGCRFVSLQYGDVEPDVRLVRDRFGVDLRVDDDIDPLTDIDGFAAQVAAMDAVVSIANSTVAMAHGTGRPCYAALRVIQDDWRYSRRSPRSRWLPTVRYEWQTSLGDWQAPLAALADAIRADFGDRIQR